MKSCYELGRSRFQETVLHAHCHNRPDTNGGEDEEELRWLAKSHMTAMPPKPQHRGKSAALNHGWSCAVLGEVSCGEASCLTRTHGTGLCWQQCPWQALWAVWHQAHQHSHCFPADTPGLWDARMAFPSPLVWLRVLPPHYPSRLPGSNSCVHRFWLLKHYSNKRKRSVGQSMPKPSGSELEQKHWLPRVKPCWLNSSTVSSCFTSGFMYSLVISIGAHKQDLGRCISMFLLVLSLLSMLITCRAIVWAPTFCSIICCCCK